MSAVIVALGFSAQCAVAAASILRDGPFVVNDRLRRGVADAGEEAVEPHADGVHVVLRRAVGGDLIDWVAGQAGEVG